MSRSISFHGRFAPVAFATALTAAIALSPAMAFSADEAVKADAAPAAVASVAPAPAAAAPVDLGKVESLTIDTGASVLLSGRDAQRQLIVMGKHATGAIRDVTRNVTYSTNPAGIAAV